MTAADLLAQHPEDPRAQVLALAAEAVLTARNVAYGEPEDNFKTIAALWNAYLAAIGPRPLEPHDVAVLMILVKIARIAATPEGQDHWVDSGGYSACGWQAIFRSRGLDNPR